MLTYLSPHHITITPLTSEKERKFVKNKKEPFHSIIANYYLSHYNCKKHLNIIQCAWWWRISETVFHNGHPSLDYIELIILCPWRHTTHLQRKKDLYAAECSDMLIAGIVTPLIALSVSHGRGPSRVHSTASQA